MNIGNLINNFKEVFNFKPFHSSSIISSEQQTQSKRLVKFASLSFAVSFLVLEPSLAMAADNAQDFQAMIDIILTFLTGTIAKSVAILAVVILGFMAMAGKLAWDVAGKVILGIILIFSATQIVELFIGGA